MDKTHIAKIFEQFLSSIVVDRFVIEKIDSYVRHWEKELVELDVKCSVCEYILRHKKEKNIVVKLQQLNSIGKQMPENLTGILLVWLYIQYEFAIENRQANLIDPLSILIHVLIGCCENDQDATVNMSRLMKETVVNTIKIYHDKDRAPEITQQFKEFIRQLGSCDRYGCIYADTGELKLLLDSRLVPDGRAYVSEDWIANNMSHSFVTYHNEKHYATLQPGLEYYKVDGGKSPMCDQTNDDPKMFLSADKREPLETKEMYCIAKKKIEEQQQDCVRNAKFILSLCSHVDSVSNENDTIMGLINKAFPSCEWCCLCVIPGMRSMINDLSIMAKQTLTSCGIGSHVHHHSPLIINHHLQNRQRKQKLQINSHSSFHVSFNFNRYFLTKQTIEHTIVEWRREKYPLLNHIFSTIDIESLWNHVSLMGDVYCKKNIKRTYIHTDLHQMQNTHTCPVTHAIWILNLLINSNIKVQKERSKMQQMAIAHNLHISSSCLHASNGE